jgi:hypothetical protein
VLARGHLHCGLERLVHALHSSGRSGRSSSFLDFSAMAPMKVRKRKRTKASSPLATSTKEIKDMFQAIGEAITRWQQVESVLFDIFDNCMTCRALGPPAVAFTAVDNFRAKLAMTDAVVRLRLKGSDADLAKWEALRNRTAKYIIAMLSAYPN